MFSIPKPLQHIFPIPFHVKIKQIWTCHGKKHVTYQFRVKNEDNPERINANWRFRDWVWVVNKSNIKNCGMMCMGAVFWSVGAYQAKTNKISVRCTICFFVTVKKIKFLDVRSCDWKFLKNTHNLSQSCHRARPYYTAEGGSFSVEISKNIFTSCFFPYANQWLTVHAMKMMTKHHNCNML